MHKYDNFGDTLPKIDWKSQTLKKYANNFYKVVY